MATSASLITLLSERYTKTCDEWELDEPFPPTKSAKKYFSQFIPPLHTVSLLKTLKFLFLPVEQDYNS